MMASFYYYDQDPSGFCFLVQITACYLNLTGATKFKYEKKNEKNSGRSSKMRPSCKWPIERFTHVTSIYANLWEQKKAFT